MTAKAPGSQAPDGSLYVVLQMGTGTKAAGQYAPDGSKYGVKP